MGGGAALVQRQGRALGHFLFRQTPGEIVQGQVEIWPTSMVFRKGHRIRLDVQPRDGIGSQSYMHYHADYNTGTNTIHAGGDRESFLLLPVIPANE